MSVMDTTNNFDKGFGLLNEQTYFGCCIKLLAQYFNRTRIKSFPNSI